VSRPQLSFHAFSAQLPARRTHRKLHFACCKIFHFRGQTGHRLTFAHTHMPTLADAVRGQRRQGCHPQPFRMQLAFGKTRGKNFLARLGQQTHAFIRPEGGGAGGKLPEARK